MLAREYEEVRLLKNVGRRRPAIARRLQVAKPADLTQPGRGRAFRAFALRRTAPRHATTPSWKSTSNCPSTSNARWRRSTSCTATSRCSRSTGDAIRAAARRHGCDEREVLVAERDFPLGTFVAAGANMGLFGGRKLVDLRIPGGKPGTEGARALQAYGERPNPDQVLLVTLPRLDRPAQAPGWYKARAAAGVARWHPLERDDLPGWIAGRLARKQQRAGSETLSFLADRCEGNLFAARQEIEKLGLLLPGEVAHDAVLQAVADVARFDVFQLSEAWLTGDAARAIRIIVALEARAKASSCCCGNSARTSTRWRRTRGDGGGNTGRDRGAQRARLGQAPGGDGTRRTAAASGRRAAAAGTRPARRASKGIGRGNAWDDLQSLAMALSGKPAFTAGAAS
ncbi:MAG: DNA polymerase III subunit delta [Betaproteobacteria bacterium]|nr:DNA polymerase III subunit delta [Betaproteobacteria bacterium]